MKISQIITEKYENQDPNRPADQIDHHGGQMWYDTNGNYHRDGDLPAIIWDDGAQTWFRHGDRHRDGDKPAYISSNGTQAWWQHGKRHRETGPAIIHANGDIEFWLNHVEYTEEEWAEKVGMIRGMRRHEILVMKHKLGLH